MSSGCTVIAGASKPQGSVDKTELGYITVKSLVKNRGRSTIDKVTGKSNFYLEVYQSCEDETALKNSFISDFRTWSESCVLAINSDIRTNEAEAKIARISEEKRKRERSADNWFSRREAEIRADNKKYGASLLTPAIDVANAMTCGFHGDIKEATKHKVLKMRKNQVSWYMVEDIQRQGIYTIAYLRAINFCNRLEKFYEDI